MNSDVEQFACPHCGSLMARCKETRNLKIRGVVLKIRVRECARCHISFRTKEVTQDDFDQLSIKRRVRQVEDQPDFQPTPLVESQVFPPEEHGANQAPLIEEPTTPIQLPIFEVDDPFPPPENGNGKTKKKKSSRSS